MGKTISIINKTRMLFLSFVAVAFAFVGVIGIAQPAFAAGECGSGYTRVGSHAMRDYENNGGDSYTGTLEVYWSGSAGKNCAIARCDSPNCGKTLFREVHIKRTTDISWNDNDAGWWKTFAGPVYSASSRGKCIKIMAAFSSKAAGTTTGDKGAVTFSGYCG